MASGRRHAQGFSLLELVVVVCAIAILAGVALDRLLPLIGRAQRVAFLDVRRELQSSLLLEAAERITRGEAATLAELAGGNPMALLLEPPANYLGSISWVDVERIPRASWYFDEHDRYLAYRVGRYTRFDAKDGPPDLIELKVVFDAAADRFDGLRLEPVHGYDWPD
jgi:prepilin-type N-terminal cleavage/methylation domain-containing protein